MAHATKLVTNIRVKCRESSSFYDQIFRCFFPLRWQVTLRKKLRNLCGVLNLLNVRIFAPLDVAHVRKSTNEYRCAKPIINITATCCTRAVLVLSKKFSSLSNLIQLSPDFSENIHVHLNSEEVTLFISWWSKFSPNSALAISSKVSITTRE